MSLARRRWSPIVDALEASRLPTTEFARRAGVNGRTLSWWRWKLREEERQAGSRPVFVEVVIAEARGTPVPVRVYLGLGDAFIDVEAHTDLGAVRRVLEALC